ncbi:hypothetical protein ABIF66_001805 [Bradyrhizobium japonicum]
MGTRSIYIAVIAVLLPMTAAASERCELSKDQQTIQVFADPNADKSTTCSFVCNISDETNSEAQLNCILDGAQPEGDGSVCTFDLSFLKNPSVKSSQRSCAIKK